MVRCPTRHDLQRFLDSRCSGDEARAIEAHRSGCPECGTWLDEAHREEDRLVADVRRLLATEDEPRAKQTAAEPALARYRILGELGAGGMGVVYRAEQRNPQRQVALKLMRAGMVSASAARRFELEVEVLARLDHPGIAQILEADTLETGGERRPFFAMELVEGRPLDAWARDRELDVRARVELFVKVCDAVHHAHQKGVMHRDLKPGNILVTDDGQPKVLDFGVARALDAEGDPTEATQAGQLIGTLAYMSPEQADCDPSAVDTRSDVYSLGVLLYGLLAGRPPYSVAGKSTSEGARIIREHAPAPLRALAPSVAKDLETIVLAALEKDKERRYDSAAALAADLRRFLGGEPIAARPPSTLYSLGKLARRNKLLVAGVLVSVVIILAGIAATSWQAYRAGIAETVAAESAQAAEQARGEALLRAAEAEQEARTVEAVNEFLLALLAGDPADAQDRPADFTLREALDEAERVALARLSGEPKVEAAVRVALGTVLNLRGEHARAGEHLERALALRRGAYGPVHRAVAGSLNALATQRYSAGRLEEAIQLCREALGIYDQLEPPPRPQVATTLYNLGSLLIERGELDDAERHLAQALALYRGEFGDANAHVASTLTMMGALEHRRGDEARAVESYREALDVFESTGAENLTMASTYNRLGEILVRLERYEEAIPAGRAALRLDASILGEGHARSGLAARNLARSLGLTGRLEEAEEVLSVALEAARSAREDLAGLLQRLGCVLLDLGRAEDAIEALSEALVRLEQEGPYDPAVHCNALVTLARAESAEGARAAELADSAYGAYQGAVASGRRLAWYELLELSALLYSAGRMQAAEALADHVLPGDGQPTVTDSPRCLRALIAVHTARGETDRAASYAEQLSERERIR